MKQLFDLFPVIVFFVAYVGFGKDIILATLAILVASTVQVVLGWLLWRTADRMHLATFGVLLVFGGLTVFLHDPTFIKWKPSIIDGMFALVLAGGAFAGERNLMQRMTEALIARAMPGANIDAPPATWRLLNVAAILFFLGCAAANLYVAYHYPEDTWVKFKVFGLTALNFVFIIAVVTWLMRHVREPQSDAATDKPDAG